MEIRLGYDGRNRLEFRGYVKALNLRTPLEIVCEDEFWQCRRRNITASGTTTLAALLKKCGLEVGYAETLTLQNYAVPDKSVSSGTGRPYETLRSGRIFRPGRKGLGLSAGKGRGDSVNTSCAATSS